MDALDLIKADAARFRTAPRRRVILALLIACGSIGLGIGWRRDLIGLDSGAACLAVGLAGAGAFALALPARDNVVRRALAIVGALLLLVSMRWLGGGMAIPYPTQGVFWGEIGLCFA